MNIVVPDYHMHTPRCNHASGCMQEYAEAALRAGLREIGFSDHAPMPDDFDAEWRMRPAELEDYLDEWQEVQAFSQAHGLTVRCALEVDYRADQRDYTRQLIAGHSWDYIIGSIHFIDAWGFDNPDEQQGWEQWSLADAWVAYFDAVAASASSGLFDIIAHPDLLKKYTHLQPSDARVDAAELRMLEAVKANNCCLEISSAGLRKPVGEIYPRSAMVKRAAAMGIPFAYGSDAHTPMDVGHAMQECLECLYTHGIHQVASFAGRERNMQDFTHD